MWTFTPKRMRPAMHGTHKKGRPELIRDGLWTGRKTLQILQNPTDLLDKHHLVNLAERACLQAVQVDTARELRCIKGNRV